MGHTKNISAEFDATLILKFIFVCFSVFLLAQSLFGTSHDIYGFYRSLFLLASPMLFDAVDDFVFLVKNNDESINFKRSSKVMIWIRLITATICFAFPIVTFMTQDEFKLLYEHIHNNKDWQWAILFFVLHCVCTISHTGLLVFSKNEKQETELSVAERPMSGEGV